MSSQTEKVVYIILMVLFAALGSLLANFVYSYQVLANGLLGISVVYLLTSKKQFITGGTIEDLLSHPKRMRTLYLLAIDSFLLMLSIRMIYRMLVSLF